MVPVDRDGVARDRTPVAHGCSMGHDGAAAMKFVVIVGSVRSERQGLKAARFVSRSLEARGHEVSLIDPAEVQLPLLDRMYKEHPKGSAPEVLERLAATYRASDGFVIVS